MGEKPKDVYLVGKWRGFWTEVNQGGHKFLMVATDNVIRKPVHGFLGWAFGKHSQVTLG